MRIFFPNITRDYVSSVEEIVSVHLLGLSILDSHPPMDFFDEDTHTNEEPEYPSIPCFNSLPNNIFFTFSPCVGTPLDNVISMLHGGLARIGDTVHSGLEQPAHCLSGKYVLLICAFVPATWLQSEYTCFLSCFSILSHQLSSVPNFEIVLVPKMRKQWDHDSDAFHNFLSAFLGRLVVPFSHSITRDKICHFLSFISDLTALLLGPDHKVLLDNVDDILSCHSIITKQGVPYFLPHPPPPKDTPCFSLAWLLNANQGDPSCLLHNLNSTQTISVAQLSNKLVGLYLFQLGDKFQSFLKLYNQCKDEGLDFEIVLVAIPFFSSIHPLVFDDVVLSQVRKLIPDTSWWVLPYDHCACVRLYNICHGFAEDRMITVGPHTSFFVDECGGEVAQHFGIQAYPFNREVVVRIYLDRAKDVTLESLLTFGSIDYLVRSGERVPVASLKGKNVILYADFSMGNNKFLIYNNLVIWYNEHKKQFPDFEVVFVYGHPAFSEDPFPETDIEMLVRPFDPDHSRFISSHPAFFLRSDQFGNPVNGIKPSLLAFGKDGHLHSLQPMNFTTGCLNTNRFHCEYSSLREDIIDDLTSEFDFMIGYQARKPFDVVSLN